MIDLNKFKEKCCDELLFGANSSTATGPYCSGDLIFEDTFDIFDTRKWQHENTLSGDGVSKINPNRKSLCRCFSVGLMKSARSI